MRAAVARKPAPEAPKTLDELRDAWFARDEQYRKNGVLLTEEEEIAVRRNRMREAETIDPKDRGQAWREAKSWYQPI